MYQDTKNYFATNTALLNYMSLVQGRHLIMHRANRLLTLNLVIGGVELRPDESGFVFRFRRVCG